MRRALATVLGLALLLAPAHADEPELPRHFLSGESAEGDWCTLVAKLSWDAPCEAKVPERIVVTYRVKSASQEGYEVTTETIPPHARSWEARWIPRNSKRIQDLCGLAPEARVLDVKSKHEPHTIADRKFHDCWHVTFVTEEEGIRQENDLWLVPALCAFRIGSLSTRVVSGPGPHLAVDMVVAGFGRKDTLLWGKKADELR